MDYSHIKPQSKVYKALLNISNSCAMNTPEIKALEQQSKYFTSVALQFHSLDGLPPILSSAWPTSLHPQARERWFRLEGQSCWSPVGRGQKKVLFANTCYWSAEEKKASDSHKVFLCILRKVQSTCTGTKKLLAGGRWSLLPCVFYEPPWSPLCWSLCNPHAK